MTIFVYTCKRTGCLAATQVPEKGMNVYALAFFTGWLRGLGWKRLLFRSDNERALSAFLRAAAASLEGVEVIEQASPKGDHAANGLAEVGVREVKAQTRVLKSHLEERLKRQLDWSEPLATWLVRHSATCLSRYRIQTDGKTPDQRRTGKRWRRQAVEFGEKAAFLPVAARLEGRVAGDAERMMDGIFVGHLHPQQLSPFPERLELPFSSDDTLSGYEDLVSSGSDRFTMWGKMSPHEVSAEHVVDIHKVVADFRDAFERKQSSSSQTYGVNKYFSSQSPSTLTSTSSLSTFMTQGEACQIKFLKVNKDGCCKELFHVPHFVGPQSVVRSSLPCCPCISATSTPRRKASPRSSSKLFVPF